MTNPLIQHLVWVEMVTSDQPSDTASGLGGDGD